VKGFGLALLIAWSPPAAAGVLLEGELNGVPLRIEFDSHPHRALLTLDGMSRLVTVDGHDLRPPAEYRLRRWSTGPPIAGYGTTYHVLTRDATICGEVLAAGWMASYLAPAIEVIAGLQQTDKRLAPVVRSDCGAIPFAAFATSGFPLMAGWKDEPVFVTTKLRFDDVPLPDAVPAASSGVTGHVARPSPSR
jgi:hypothetical protein